MTLLHVSRHLCENCVQSVQQNAQVLLVKCQRGSESDRRVPTHAEVDPQPPHLCDDPLPPRRGVAVHSAEGAPAPHIGQQARVSGAQVSQTCLQLLPHLRHLGQELLLHDRVEDGL